MARTEDDKLALRREAQQRVGILQLTSSSLFHLTFFKVASQNDLVLDDEETIGMDNKAIHRDGSSRPGGACKVVIDKHGGTGMVQVTGKNGYASAQIWTGAKWDGYETLDIEDGQRCTMIGSAVVLYVLRT
jgi:hypothetical protein